MGDISTYNQFIQKYTVAVRVIGELVVEGQLSFEEATKVASIVYDDLAKTYENKSH